MTTVTHYVYPNIRWPPSQSSIFRKIHTFYMFNFVHNYKAKHLFFRWQVRKRKSSYIWVNRLTANRMILKSFSIFWYRDAQISQKSNSYLKILTSRRVTWSKFHTKDPQTLGAIKQNLVGWVTWTWDLCTCTSNTIKFQTAPDSRKHFNCSSSQWHKPSWKRKQQASKHGF